MSPDDATPRPVPLRALPAARRAVDPRDAIAVTVHDVEPATWERCALLREWLADHGVARVTLLVIPAPDLHPFDRRSPALRAWLGERIDAGDEVAQHGFRHEQTRPAAPLRQAVALWQGGRAAEFVGLDAEETDRAVAAGRRILTDAGIEPDGFVAPGFAYTPSLHATLRERYAWWATIDAVHGGGRPRPLRALALGLGASTPLKRFASPAVLRTASRIGGGPVRLELHPADLDHPRLIAAAEDVLRRHARRPSVTYRELVAAA